MWIEHIGRKIWRILQAVQLAPTIVSLVVTGAAACDLACLAENPQVASSHGPDAPKGRPSSSGAIGANREWEAGKLPMFSVDEQKEAASYVEVGLIRHRQDWEGEGWLGIDWALAHQNADGTFQGKDAVHSATMFLEAAARALLLERELGRGEAHAEITAAVVRGARSLAARDAESDPALLKNAEYTHRIWMMAALLQETARLTGDKSLAAKADEYARRAISHQWPDGVMPEAGGFDVGYHAASLLYAARFLAEIGNGSLVTSVKGSLQLGANWLAGRVRNDGSVDPTGSTRTGVEHTRKGVVKGIFYGLISEAFASTGLALKQSEFLDLSRRIEASEDFKKWAGG